MTQTSASEIEKEGKRKKVSEVSDLKSLVGRKVKSLRDFNGIEIGRSGRIDEFYRLSGVDYVGIMVAWDDPRNGISKPIRDGFGRDKNFDETQWLELI